MPLQYLISLTPTDRINWSAVMCPCVFGRSSIILSMSFIFDPPCDKFIHTFSPFWRRAGTRSLSIESPNIIVVNPDLGCGTGVSMLGLLVTLLSPNNESSLTLALSVSAVSVVLHNRWVFVYSSYRHGIPFPILPVRFYITGINAV